MSCNDPEHMEEPVTCDWCNEWVELQKMEFIDVNGRQVGLCQQCAEDAQEKEMEP